MPEDRDARQPMTRSSSASDSLQNNLAKDVELSLTSAARHSTWRDSMSGLARSMLLKAKDSIDTLRGVPEPGHRANRVEAAAGTSHRSLSSARASLRSMKHGNQDDTADGHRATLSLRRVLTSSSRRSKRSPLLVNLMAKRSTTRLQGPEELIDDDSASHSHSSPARESLQSLCKQDSPHSKASSLRSSTPWRLHARHRSTQGSPTRASSPIPIPSSSSPPTIQFEIESGNMSPERIFGLEPSSSPSKLDKVQIPIIDVATRDGMIIHGRRAKRQGTTEDMDALKEGRVPRRSSNDHWRLRRTSRSRPSNLPEPTKQSTSRENLPSPMPGTNLPLEDPFDSSASSSERRELLCRASSCLDGTEDRNLTSRKTFAAQPTLSGTLQSPSAGHIDATSGQWVSNDPVARVTTSSGTTATMVALQEATRHLTAKQALLEETPEAFSPTILRAELEAGRKALERLEDRMAGIETELRKNIPTPSTPTPQRNAAPGRVFPKPRPLPINRELSRSEPGQSEATTPVGSRVASSQMSFSSTDSPLEVQDLFYASDREADTKQESRPSTVDVAQSAPFQVDKHLCDPQTDATSKLKSSGPTHPQRTDGKADPQTMESFESLLESAEARSLGSYVIFTRPIHGPDDPVIPFDQAQSSFVLPGSSWESPHGKLAGAGKYDILTEEDIISSVDEAQYTAGFLGGIYGSGSSLDATPPLKGGVPPVAEKSSIDNDEPMSKPTPVNAKADFTIPLPMLGNADAVLPAKVKENNMDTLAIPPSPGCEDNAATTSDRNNDGTTTPTRQCQSNLDTSTSLGLCPNREAQLAGRIPSRDLTPRIDRKSVGPSTPSSLLFRSCPDPAFGPYQRPASTESSPTPVRCSSGHSVRLSEFGGMHHDTSPCLTPIAQV
ncbi:hypothetical protein ANO11243_060390 [Dothideomycetidae sp. 11243]|nr:hypothetical protein ANO11243_060390 [fungal sp. No.11243]